jgi:hypothetical protein
MRQVRPVKRTEVGAAIVYGPFVASLSVMITHDKRQKNNLCN